MAAAEHVHIGGVNEVHDGKSKGDPEKDFEICPIDGVKYLNKEEHEKEEKHVGRLLALMHLQAEDVLYSGSYSPSYIEKWKETAQRLEAKLFNAQFNKSGCPHPPDHRNCDCRNSGESCCCAACHKFNLDRPNDRCCGFCPKYWENYDVKEDTEKF